MKKQFYDENQNNVTPKVMRFMWSILILDTIIFTCLFGLYLCAIGILNF